MARKSHGTDTTEKYSTREKRKSQTAVTVKSIHRLITRQHETVKIHLEATLGWVISALPLPPYHRYSSALETGIRPVVPL